MSYTISRLRATPAWLFLAAGLALAGGCSDTGASLGASRPEARVNADALFYSLGVRFGPVQSAAGYAETREKFSRSALVPSRLYADSSLWSHTAGTLRELQLAGRPSSTGYLIGARDGVALPRLPGEYRRSNRLRFLERDQFEWTIRDELAVGSVSPGELAAALTTLLHAAERTGGAGVSTIYRAALPRTTASLGRLFTLESVNLTPMASGGTLVSLVATLHPDRLAQVYPHFGRYLQRYVSPASFEAVARDADGSRWWTAALNRDRLSLEFRIHDGHLAPLDGGVRRMPDRFRVDTEMATRIRLFNVGISGLVADVSLTRAHREKAFTARFRREPQWHLPLLVERLIRTPLRRPFEGDGAMMSLAARESPGGTLLVRDYQLVVQESAILRWFGGLGSSAMDDFRAGAEAEYDRFVGEVFAALRTDAGAILR